MVRLVNDTTLFPGIEENVPNSWPLIKEEHLTGVNKEDKNEQKDTLYFEENNDAVMSSTPVEPELKEIGSMVQEYENWEGRVVSTEALFVRARMVNTQRHYSPRIVRIDRTVFFAKGIKKELIVGDRFELTFRYVRIETINKKKQLAYNNRYIDTLRIIEPVTITRKELDALTNQKLKRFSYLFKDG